MNPHVRRLVLVCALVGVVSLSFGTQGLSTGSLQRGVEGKIAADPDAYLGVDAVGFDSCGPQILLELRNQYPGDVDVAVDVRVLETEGVYVTGFDAPTYLAADGVGTVSGNLTARNGTASNAVTVRVVAEGGGVRTNLTRSYPVACDG